MVASNFNTSTFACGARPLALFLESKSLGALVTGGDARLVAEFNALARDDNGWCPNLLAAHAETLNGGLDELMMQFAAMNFCHHACAYHRRIHLPVSRRLCFEQ